MLSIRLPVYSFYPTPLPFLSSLPFFLCIISLDDWGGGVFPCVHFSYSSSLSSSFLTFLFLLVVFVLACSCSFFSCPCSSFFQFFFFCLFLFLLLLPLIFLFPASVQNEYIAGSPGGALDPQNEFPRQKIATPLTQRKYIHRILKHE